MVHPQIQTTVEDIFQSLKSQIENFYNSTKFTSDEFLNHEKVEISVVLNVLTMNQTSFSGELQISGIRPIYDSDYNSPTFRIKDDEVSFTYQESQPLEYMEGTPSNNLTGILSFYAFFALGMDYDSYSPKGGTPYFNKALNIANASQASGGGGWSATDKGRDNRYWLVFQVMDERFSDFRSSVYTYHRIGMDKFTQDGEATRKEILKSLKMLVEVHKNQPNSHLMQVYMTTKRQEIIGIFSKANTSEKNELYSIIEVVDIANVSRYKTKLGS